MMRLTKHPSSFSVASWLILFLTAAITLSSCFADKFYDLLIENATDQEIAISIFDQQINMRPCSVRDYGYISGPLNAKSVHFTAQDTLGNVLYSAEVIPEPQPSRVPLLTVKVSSAELNTCPTPIEGAFILNVTNYTEENLPLSLDGDHLGMISAKSTKTIGPLLGALHDAYKWEIIDSTGKNRIGFADGDLYFIERIYYDLGQIPQAQIEIRYRGPSKRR